MKTWQLTWVLLLSLSCVPASAQTGRPPLSAEVIGDPTYTPQLGQEGKDVIWVPSPMEVVDLMLDIAKVTSADLVVSPGSGDGRLVIRAAQRGARAVGIEYNPNLVALSERLADKAGVSSKTSFIHADLFTVDFSKATVVGLYLLPALNLKLRHKLVQMMPGTRIVSHAFEMGDWRPDEVREVNGRRVYLWRVRGRCPNEIALQRQGEPIRFDLGTYIKSKGGVQQARGEVQDRLAKARKGSESESEQTQNFERLLSVLEACH